MKILDKISAKIKNVQSLPEKEKNRIIWTWAVIATLIIAAGWIAIFKKYELIPKNGAGLALPDFKVDLKDKFGGGFGKIKNELVPELKNMVEEEKAKNAAGDSIEYNK